MGPIGFVKNPRWGFVVRSAWDGVDNGYDREVVAVSVGALGGRGVECEVGGCDDEVDGGFFAGC